MPIILLLLLLAICSALSLLLLLLIVSIGQLFQLFHEHAFVLVLPAILHDLIDLLLHALVLFLHAPLHLLHGWVVLRVTFLHLLESFEILDLTHKLREGVVGVLAQETSAEHFRDFTIILKQTFVKNFTLALVHDVAVVIYKVTLCIDATTLAVNKVAISCLLEHRVA